MSRIRSLHPSLFTDERYMALSFPARELLKGIWCEADDQGLFEWKPLTLKARILPADAVDMVALLEELVNGQFVTKFDHEDKSYGAVRNFRKFQRPKKPNSVFFIPPELRLYVGLNSDDVAVPEPHPSPVPHQFPTSGENSPQMEDEGGRKEDSVSSLRSETAADEPPDDPVKQIFDRGLALYVAAGMAAGNARKLIGKQRQEFGNTAMLAAIGACETEMASDPVSFIAACLVRGSPIRGSPSKVRSFGAPGFA